MSWLLWEANSEKWRLKSQFSRDGGLAKLLAGRTGHVLGTFCGEACWASRGFWVVAQGIREREELRVPLRFVS